MHDMRNYEISGHRMLGFLSPAFIYTAKDFDISKKKTYKLQ